MKPCNVVSNCAAFGNQECADVSREGIVARTYRRVSRAVLLPFAPTPSELYQSHPEYFADPTDTNGTNLYGDLLQKSMIDWLGQYYRVSWESESVSFESSVGTHSRFGPPEKLSEQSRIYSPTDVQLILGANKFADVKTAGPVKQIAVPLGTSLTIRSSSKASPSQPSEILLKNEFCKLSIKSSFSWYAGGVGTLRSMSGLTDAGDRDLGTATYTVKIDIEFSRLRSGHPKMPLYRKWAVGIAEGLRDQFDEQTIWARTKSDYLFQKQVEQLGPIKQTWGDAN
jgi:hypothetical protein